MINTEYIASIADNYKNPWELMLDKFNGRPLSRLEILTIVETFNNNAKYK